MEQFEEARAEIRAYCSSPLGIGAQSYDPRGEGTDTDPSGRRWERLADDRHLKAVRDHVAIERTLYAIEPAPRELLREWGTPRVCIYPKVRAALGHLAFVAKFTQIACEECGEPTQDALDKLSKDKLRRIADAAEKMLVAALAKYDEARIARIDRDASHAEQQRARRRARLDTEKVGEARSLFTPEEIAELRRMAGTD